jgi:hypothetical protein
VTGQFFNESNQNVFETRTLPPYLIDYDSNVNDSLIVMTNEPINDGELARVTRLDLSLPTAADMAVSPLSILVVSSTATLGEDLDRPADERRTRTVRTLLTGLPVFPSMNIDAAITSHLESGTGGQFNVHWGAAWSKGDLMLPNGGVNNVPTTLEDPISHLNAVGNVLMSSGKYADGTSNGSLDPLPPEAPNYYEPWLGYDPLHLNIHQHVDPSLYNWPTLEYEEWKLAALDRGHYFSTDAEGNLYYGTEENESTLIDLTEFAEIIDQRGDLTVNTAVPGDQTLPEEKVIFIDTVDGLPPNNPLDPSLSTNLANVEISGGGGIFTRGIFYVAGNIEIGGAGGPPDIWIQDPEFLASGGVFGTQELQGVRHMGVIYTDGVYLQEGNQITYGAIIARGGFGTGGTPNVYYNARGSDRAVLLRTSGAHGRSPEAGAPPRGVLPQGTPRFFSVGRLGSECSRASRGVV